MHADAICTKSLTKRYRVLEALRDLDLTVRRGEIVGLIGPNGSGKSTTLKILLNLVFPTSGEARVLGLDVVRDSIEIRRVTGFVSDESRLYRSARGRLLLRLTESLRRRRASSAVPGRQAELARRLDVPLKRRVKTYSTGMKQKLALVLALAHDPDLLLLDEPTNGLDPTSRAQVLDLVHQEHRRGKSILLSSHVLPEIERLCDRIVFLRAGRIVSDEEVAATRARLARHVTVAFDGDVPDSAVLERGAKRVVRRRRDVLVEANGDPRELIARLAELPLVSLEYRAPSLDDVYQELYPEGTGL
jgi:ABC-2 type transport system ATP-binding protein